jgi:ABC-type glycerol-3-phosphate transport system substrate-binding protein
MDGRSQQPPGGAFEIDARHPIPLYFQVKRLLLEALVRGDYRAGERLPTEHELCALYGISRTPVTRALSELAEEGVIVRHRRRGTFVSPHWAARPPGQPEVRIVVPEGPWADMVQAAAPGDVRLNIVTVPRPALHRTLTHAVGEGRAPDIAVLDSVWVAEFAAAGSLHALDDLDEEWLRREHDVDFLDALVAAERFDGRTYAVSAVADVAGLWYRRRELERAGVAPAATWAQLRAAARALRAGGMAHPIVMPGGSVGGETTAYCLLAVLASNGGRVLSGGGVGLHSPETVQALRFLRRLVDDRLMSPDVVGYEWNRPIRLLAQGKAALCFGGSYEARTLAEHMGVPLEELWGHVGFLPVPGGPRGERPASVTGGMVFGIFRQAAQPKLAMRLLESVLAPDALARMAAVAGRVPPRRGAIALAELEPAFVAMVVQTLERAVTRPATPAYPRVSAQLQAMLEAVLTGRLGAERAAQRTAEMIEAITGLPVLRDTEARAPAAPVPALPVVAAEPLGG